MYDFISLQDDPIFKIRREVALRLMKVSRVLGEQIFNGVIIPVYKKLSQDSIWSVRKACVEMLPEVSRISSDQIKNSQIIQLFNKFSQDSSKWVKMATFQHFGPFIFSYESMEPKQVLLDYYVSMGKQTVTEKPGAAVAKNIAQVDNETAYYCAYNFPAVLRTVGPAHWHDKLKPMHDQMVTDMRWKVRRSLSFSMHECAKILGPAITEQDLMPVLFHFLQDIADVAEGVLENLPEILKVLSQEQRDQYIELFIQAQNKVEKANQN